MKQVVRVIKQTLFILMIVHVLSGCGVRGKPQPPLRPPEIGRGQPTFKRATEEYAFPDVPAPSSQNTPQATPEATESE